MRVWLFANIKDEENVVEWALHHARFGFERIHIFDHVSATPISNLLEPYQTTFKEKGVSVVCKVIDWALPMKMRCMNYALEMCKQEKVDWILYIDADEYLSLHTRHGDSVARYIEFVTTVKEHTGVVARGRNYGFSQTTSSAPISSATTAKEIGAIAINWLIFGSSMLDEQPESKTLMDNFTRCEGTLNFHVKSLVKVNCAKCATNPHFYELKPTCIAVASDGKGIEKLAADFSKVEEEFHSLIRNFSKERVGPFNFRVPLTLEEKPEAFIAHYMHQSYAHNNLRKILRPRDDNGKFRPLPTKEQFHSICNQREFDQMKSRYSNLVTASMCK